jgi:hypothetical protein
MAKSVKERSYSSEYSSKIDELMTIGDDKMLTILDAFSEVLKEDIGLWERKGVLGKGTTSSDIDDFVSNLIKESGITEFMHKEFHERKYQSHLLMLEHYDATEASNLAKAAELKEEALDMTPSKREEDAARRKAYLENRQSELEVRSRRSYEKYTFAEYNYSLQSTEVRRLEKELEAQKELGRSEKKIKRTESELEKARAELSRLERKVSSAFDKAEKDYTAALKNASKLKIPTSCPDPRGYAYLDEQNNFKFKEAMEDKILGPRLQKNLKDKIGNAILSGKKPEEIVSMIEEFVVGKSGDRSQVHDLLKSTSEELLFMYQGALGLSLANGKTIVGYTYEGPIDNKIRLQCNRWMGFRVIPAHRLAKEIELAKKNGSGMRPDTTVDNFTIHRGGYNCRHVSNIITDVTDWSEGGSVKPPSRSTFEDFVDSLSESALESAGEGLSDTRGKYRRPGLDADINARLDRLRGQLEGLEGDALLAAQGQVRNIERMAKLEEGVKGLISHMDELSDDVVDKVMELSDGYDVKRPGKFLDAVSNFVPVSRTGSKLDMGVRDVQRVVDEVYMDAREHHRLFNNVDIGNLGSKELSRIREGITSRFGSAEGYNERILDKIKSDVKAAATLHPTDKDARRDYLLSKGYSKDDNSWLRNMFKKDIIDYVYKFSGSVESRALRRLGGEDYGVYFQRNTLNYFDGRSPLGDRLLKEKGFISSKEFDSVKEELKSEGIDITDLMIDRGGRGSVGILTPISKKNYDILFGGENHLLSSRFL